MLSLLLMSPHGVAEEALPAGLLEFLGTMVESNGEWVDPLNLATPVESILLDEIRREEIGRDTAETRESPVEAEAQGEHGDG